MIAMPQHMPSQSPAQRIPLTVPLRRGERIDSQYGNIDAHEWARRELARIQRANPRAHLAPNVGPRVVLYV